MTEKSIGCKLRKLRESACLSVKDVIKELAKMGFPISDKALYSYESGTRCASADMFLALCEIYHCNHVLEVFSDIEIDYSIPTDAEMQLIEKYRALDDYGKETVSIILDREASRTAQVKDVSKQTPAISRIYTYMRKIAAAGVGFYFDDIPTDTIEAPYCENADFIIGISGDSMEPTFLDGDLVYVEKRQVVKIGEIGIFIVNGECFIKEAGEDGLISHNKKYKMIPGTESITCVGKVLEKVDISEKRCRQS